MRTHTSLLVLALTLVAQLLLATQADAGTIDVAALPPGYRFAASAPGFSPVVKACVGGRSRPSVLWTGRFVCCRGMLIGAPSAEPAKLGAWPEVLCSPGVTHDVGEISPHPAGGDAVEVGRFGAEAGVGCSRDLFRPGRVLVAEHLAPALCHATKCA